MRTIDAGVRRGRGRVLPAVATLALAAAGCGFGGGDTGPSTTLAFGLAESPITLDPARDVIRGSPIKALSNDTLIDYKADRTLAPGLAESWAYADTERGPRTAFELALRGGVVFSDGTPFNAAAVKTWLDYYRGAGGPQSGFFSQIADVEAVDDLRVRIQLTSPNPNIPETLSDAYSSWGQVSCPSAVADPAGLGVKTCGVGPYVLVPEETVSGDHYTFVPNPSYYDRSKARYQRVVAKVISSPSTMLQALQSGQIDVAEGDLSTAPAAKQLPGVTVASMPGGTDTLVFMDRQGAIAPPLADVRVRQALSYAIDRKAIAAAIAGEFGRASSELYMPGISNPESIDRYPYDPEKARALLREAGYPSGFSFGLIGQAGHGAFAQSLAKYFHDVGVTVTVKQMTTVGDLIKNLQGGTEPTATEYWVAPTMQTVHDTIVGPETFLNYGPGDPEVEAAYSRGLLAEDPQADWRTISKRLVDEALMLNVYNYDLTAYSTGKVTGVQVTGWGLFNPVDWVPAGAPPA